jgi:hypothetical protein
MYIRRLKIFWYFKSHFRMLYINVTRANEHIA